MIKSGLVELDKGWDRKEEKFLFGESRRMGISLSLCCEHEESVLENEVSGTVYTRFANEDFPSGPVVKTPRFHYLFHFW